MGVGVKGGGEGWGEGCFFLYCRHDFKYYCLWETFDECTILPVFKPVVYKLDIQ